MEFDPTEYAISEADGSAQLVVKASAPASFDYDVVITTSDLSATGKNAPFLSLCFVCVCEFTYTVMVPVTPSPLIILPFS